MVNLGWDWTLPVLWVLVIGNLFSNLMSYSADQAVVQRYLTTPDEKQAARAIWTNAAVIIPISAVWFLLGTALFAFYKLNPQMLDPTLKNDQVFPLFIAQQLPDGVVGIVIAGLFAAAMSTVDSSINSISTAITTDFYRRFHVKASEQHSLRLARLLTVVFGLIGTAVALWMAANQEAIKSLWDVYMRILGLVMGGLTGLFTLGIFTRRANGVGAIIGAAASVVILWAVQTYTSIHFFLFATIGVVSCFIIGYLMSLLLPLGTKSLAGLTLYTMARKDRKA
jgi:Na+/proline symporter